MSEKIKKYEEITGIDLAYDEEMTSESENKKEISGSKEDHDIIVDEFDQYGQPNTRHVQIKYQNKKISYSNAATQSEDKLPGERKNIVKTENIYRQRNDDVTIKISGKSGEHILKDFDISDIGNINLKEAEEIADEGMLFLTESDLIEGLEDFELIPLKDEKIQADSSGMNLNLGKDDELPPIEKIIENAEPETEVLIKEKALSIEEKGNLDEGQYDNIEVAIIEVTPSDNEPDVFPESDIDNGDVEQSRKIEIDHITSEESSKDLFDMPLVVDETSYSEEKEGGDISSTKPADSDDIIFTDDNLTVAQESSLKSSSADLFRKPDDISSSQETVKGNIDEKPVELFEVDKEFANGQVDPGDEKSTGEKIELSSASEMFSFEVYEKFEKEILPDELQALEVIEDNVTFIDDILIEKPDIDESVIFTEDGIEKLSADYIDLSQVEGIVLEESEEYDSIPGTTVETGNFKKFDELTLEFEDDEYKYRDDELDFVENAIFEDDYTRYIYEIDELYQIEGRKEISIAREILGLDSEEFALIDEKLYSQEYINVNLDEIFNLIREETAAGSLTSERFCNYLLPREDSFLPEEKKSIEENISAQGALIFEEDIEKIKAKLGRKVYVKEPQTVTITEEVYDITDNIVIIEDDLDVDRFVKELPDEKQDDMKMLLKYLDGLFEKLPEGVIKKFADSEYFDTYVKVLNEMGI